MKKTMLNVSIAALTLAGAVFAYRTAFATSERSDCPGKIICPLTGHEICADKCPVSAEVALQADVRRCCKDDN